MAGNNGHDETRNPHVRHEPDDVNAHALTKFGVSMGALILIFMAGLSLLFRFLVERQAELSQPFSRAAIVNPEKLPPEPRLQRYPAHDMSLFLDKEEHSLHQYAWLDPDKGIVQIPVD